jgi:hypothetical protein
VLHDKANKDAQSRAIRRESRTKSGGYHSCRLTCLHYPVFKVLLVSVDKSSFGHIMATTILNRNSFATIARCERGQCIVIKFGPVFMRCAQDRFHELVTHFNELYQRHKQALNQTGQLLRLENESSEIDICLNAEELFLLKESLSNAYLMMQCEDILSSATSGDQQS